MKLKINQPIFNESSSHDFRECVLMEPGSEESNFFFNCMCDHEEGRKVSPIPTCVSKISLSMLCSKFFEIERCTVHFSEGGEIAAYSEAEFIISLTIALSNLSLGLLNT